MLNGKTLCWVSGLHAQRRELWASNRCVDVTVVAGKKEFMKPFFLHHPLSFCYHVWNSFIARPRYYNSRHVCSSSINLTRNGTEFLYNSGMTNISGRKLIHISETGKGKWLVRFFINFRLEHVQEEFVRIFKIYHFGARGSYCRYRFHPKTSDELRCFRRTAAYKHASL